MLFSSWLRNCKSSLDRRAELRRTRRAGAASHTASPLFLERLEDRCLLSTQIFNYNPTLPPESAVPSANSLPDAITPGPDGNVWFTEANTTNIGQITPSGVVNQILDPGGINDVVPGGFGRSIIKGPNGDLWFSANSEVNNPPNPEAIEMTPGGQVVQTVGLPPGSLPNFAVGPHNNLWFTEYRNDEISYITPDGHVHQPFTINFPAYDIIPDNAGGFWIESSGASGPGQSNMLAHITPNSTDTAITETDYSYQGHGLFRGLALDSNGKLWVGEPGASFFYGQGSGQIDEIDPSTGTMTGSFLTPTPNSQPTSLVAGPDGAVWFTEGNANQIGRITPDGIITEYTVPTPNSGVGGITLGPDGNLWFTEENANQIGEVVLYNQNQQTQTQPPVTQTAIPGISQNINLGTFTDDSGTGSWNVLIDWDDGGQTPDTTGFTDSLTGAVATQAQEAHTYATQGVYTVTETITDNTGGKATTQFQVVVGPLVVNTNNSGPGSLSEAIQEADEYPSLTNNGTTQADITFQIPTTDQNYQNGQFVIHTKGLPTITEPVFIDGYSQPGIPGVTPNASANTNPMGGADPSDNAVRKIVLDGSQATTRPENLLSITGANSTIQGLVIQNAPVEAIGITGSGTSGNVIEGNYIGIGGAYGINISGGSNNTIGGTSASARNIIAASRFGVLITRATGTLLEGNYIGVDVDGTSLIPGLGSFGVITGTDTATTIGGITSTARNVISGWKSSGVGLGDWSGPVNGDVVEGNYIGTDATGTQSLPNGQGIDASSENLIGGTTPGAGNIIAFNDGPAINADGSGERIEDNSIFNNTGPAVSVALGATGDAIEGNSIYGNFGPAIDNLGQYGDNIGPTLFDTNYAGGPFMGTNNYTTFPATLTQTGNTLTFNGTVSGLLSSTRYMVYLWTTYPDGVYRGEYYTYVCTDGSGDATFTQSFPAPSFLPPPPPQSTVTLTPAYAQFFVPHSQGNDEQNFPVLTSATSGTSTIVSGTLNGQANTTFTVDVYATNPNVIGPSDLNQGQYYGEGQYYLGQVSVTTDGNGPLDVNGHPSGDASFTADFSTANLPGGTLPDGWYISATATDPGGNTSEFSQDLTTAPATQTFSQYLAGVIPQNSSSPTVISIQAGPDQTPSTVIQAVNNLTNVNPQFPVTIIYDLGGGTFSATNVNADPPSNVALIIQNGTLNGSLTINGGNVQLKNVTVEPDVPALTVTGGQVSLLNCTLTTTGNAPTLLVTGGNVTLLNNTITQASTAYTQPAIAVTGGTLNLGTATTPGNNTLSVNSSGDLVSNTSGNPISAVGDTFVVGGTVETAPNLSFTTLTSSAAASILNQAVTLTATVQANGSSGTPTGSVDFFDTTTNTDLGHVSLSSGVAKLTTSALIAGNHLIVAKYSGDTNFLPSANSFTQSVQYHFSGFLPPLSNGLSFAVNRTIPIKFTLADYNGKAVTSLSAATSLQIQALDANGNPVGAPFNPTSTNNQGLQFSGGQYQFNWQTKGLKAGSYQIVLTLADGTTQTKPIKLTAGGSSAGLVTDGSGGTATAGALLGGEVDLYVDNSNGDMTSDELARINDAVTSIDATITPYGVTIVEVSDPTQANVTLNMNTTSSLGGSAQGVLGCTTDADQVTMIQGWNWYAGSDPTQVGAGQYDFETAVMHELGHVLGLGHSSDNNSVMYASLAAGTANRTLTAADLNVSDDDSGPCALHAVPTAAASIPGKGQSMAAVSSTSIPSGGRPLSVIDELFADFTLMLSNVRNAYQSELSSVARVWQNADALALQRLDALLRMEAGAMGLKKDNLMRDLLFAKMSSPNG